MKTSIYVNGAYDKKMAEFELNKSNKTK